MITEQEFREKVALVRERAPAHPLLPLLGNYSAMACTYLEHALRQIQSTKQVARPQVQWMDEENAGVDTEDNPQWEELQLRKSQLYGRRFNLSNQFHLYTATDNRDHDRHACANISDEIRAVQMEIMRVQRQIYHYQRTGDFLVETVQTPREYEGLALGRRYRTVQQNVTRWAKRIQQEGGSADAASLKLWRLKLENYEKELAGLKLRIDEEAL